MPPWSVVGIVVVFQIIVTCDLSSRVRETGRSVRGWGCPVFLNRVVGKRSRYLIFLDTVARSLVGKYATRFTSHRSRTLAHTSTENRCGRPE